MGITGFSFSLLERNGALEPCVKMLELGDQNLYFHPHYGKYAKLHFEKLIQQHISVDLGTQKGGAIELDLSKPIDRPEWLNHFDVVTNFGTSEHVKDGLYQCFKSVHECCAVGGLIFHENPKTGNWPGHGYHYMTEDFYKTLAKKMKYEIIELGEHPAMGNTTDGWNIFCVLKKTEDNNFMSEKVFKKLNYFES